MVSFDVSVVRAHPERYMAGSLLAGVVLTLLSAAVPARQLLGATHYGLPVPWLVAATGQGPWLINWTGAVIDLLFWTVLVFDATLLYIGLRD